MGRETKIGIVLAGSALALGLVGDVLLQGQWLGLNLAIWTTGFVVLLTVLLRLSSGPLHQGRRFMVGPLVLFSAMFAWHDSPLLLVANLVALAAAVSMGALRRTKPRPSSATLSDYGGGGVAAGAAVPAGARSPLQSRPRGEGARPPPSPQAGGGAP